MSFCTKITIFGNKKKFWLKKIKIYIFSDKISQNTKIEKRKCFNLNLSILCILRVFDLKTHKMQEFGQK